MVYGSYTMDRPADLNRQAELKLPDEQFETKIKWRYWFKDKCEPTENLFIRGTNYDMPNYAHDWKFHDNYLTLYLAQNAGL